MGMWVADTIEPGAPGSGKGTESYNFVANPSNDNPSSMWSNYTDCARLIHVDISSGGTRYLLGCDSIDCCEEPQSGNQVEFQIPNIYYANPKKTPEVEYTANVNITNFGEIVQADEWKWAWELPNGFKAEEFKAYTNDCADCYNGVELVQWQVRALGGQWFAIQFQNYKGIDPNSDEAKSFVSSFDIPEVCQKNNLLTCDDDTVKKYSMKKLF